MSKKPVPRGIKAASLVTAAIAVSFVLAGCNSSKEKAPTSFSEALSQVTSVEASVQLDIQGNASGSDGNHNASIGADMTITSVLTETPTYHMESYSRITVDGVGSRDDEEIYVVKEGSDYIQYEYVASSDEWQKHVLTKAEALSTASKTAFFPDFQAMLDTLTLDDTKELEDGTKKMIYSGDISKSYLQNIFGNNKVFGSFMTSVENLLQNSIHCQLTVDGSTYLPDSLVMDFSNSWSKSDMRFDTSTVTIQYSNWNKVSEIETPKKVTVVATDPNEEFYNTYYAWNLFLPYVGGNSTSQQGSAGNSNQTFSASWQTYQVRIDGGMTSVPLSVEDLQKIGYSIEERYSSMLIEPNQYKDGVVLTKNKDEVTVSVYNPDTAAQPVASCMIGCIDLNAADIPENGIVVYFPGEVTLGMTGEALTSAYGQPDEKVESFSSDSYVWHGEGELQSFEAEVSPVTGKVIRLKISNIPVTGGEQSGQQADDGNTSESEEASETEEPAEEEAAE